MSETTNEKTAGDLKVLDFVESSLKTVEGLEQKAEAAEKRAADAESRVVELEQQVEDARSETKQAAARTQFGRDQLEQLGNLLNSSGLTKRSSTEVADQVQEHPNLLIDLFQQFISADDSAGELTERKTASDNSDPNSLWRQAAAESK